MNLLGRFFGKGSSAPEVNSGVPLAGATDLRPPTMQEMIQKFIRTELSQRASDHGLESFEEADDFEEEDPDVLPLTHHQVVAMSDLELKEVGAAYGVEFKEEAPQEEKRRPKGRQVATAASQRVESQAPQEETDPD